MHTQNHIGKEQLTKMNISELSADFEEGANTLAKVIGEKALAPFFRFPYLHIVEELEGYLTDRGVVGVGVDIIAMDLNDDAEEVLSSLQTKLAQKGKGILLMHDYRESTPVVLPRLFKYLHEQGYQVVHLTSKTQFHVQKPLGRRSRHDL
jgi:peptidoglycan/xylan/chitin deacetylase (PgdA/CDA1 family)